MHQHSERDNRNVLRDRKFISIAKTSREFFSIRARILVWQPFVILYSFFAILRALFHTLWSEGMRNSSAPPPCGLVSPRPYPDAKRNPSPIGDLVLVYGVILYSQVGFGPQKYHFFEKNRTQSEYQSITFVEKLQKLGTDAILQENMSGTSGKNLIFECHTLIERSQSRNSCARKSEIRSNFDQNASQISQMIFILTGMTPNWSVIPIPPLSCTIQTELSYFIRIKYDMLFHVDKPYPRWWKPSENLGN